MTKNIAVYAGSFNPIHAGHVEVIRHATYLFDKVIVLIANNPSKTYAVSVDKRKEFISGIINVLDIKSNIIIDSTNESLISYCAKHNVPFIVKGIRNGNDLEYEQAQMEYSNLLLHDTNLKDIHWVLIPTDTKFRNLSSSAIRQFISYTTYNTFKETYLCFNKFSENILKDIYETYKPNKQIKCKYCGCTDTDEVKENVICHDLNQPIPYRRTLIKVYCSRCRYLIDQHYEDEVNK